MFLKFTNSRLDFSTPAIMGILNVTPDSFYDGGKYLDEKSILKRVAEMADEGVDILDVGGCSTRPGSHEISVNEELRRVIPAIKAIKKEFSSIPISVDTYHSKVAEEAIQAGGDMINDISGGQWDDSMFNTIAQLKVPYVLMHIKGIPKNMQENPVYENVTGMVKKYFEERLAALQKAGVKQVVIDPGFGFGKTTEHNFELLKNLSLFKTFSVPILAGISRKSMINRILNIKPEKALNGTTVLNTIALLNGANILRVHDVKEAKETVKLINYYNSQNIGQPRTVTDFKC